MVNPNKNIRIFGIIELYVTKLLSDEPGSEPTYDEANKIKVAGVNSLTYEGNLEEIKGRGDERVCETEYADDDAKVTFESLYFPLPAAQMINGGEIVESAEEVEYFGPGPDEVGEYFKIEAITKPRREKITIYKNRGRLEVKGMNGKQFMNATFAGTAVHTQGNIQGKPRRHSLKKTNYAMYAGGARQIETATVAGTISTAGNASVTVTASGLVGTPKEIPVAVALNDSAAVVAQKIREALASDTAIVALFEVGGAGAAVVLTKKTAAANDATLNIAIANDTCDGLTDAPTSEDTAIGQAG
ncbi:hypothetical protein M7775_19125 [Sporomusa sphaeroides DSM 2875]|uniref:hypothetical protein n=1 Tax=Sporomusa sphaeroides TaxID=47679 RepID=UPI00202FA912|nr:hypothetical protein [Sporomusa sphaeroides]MCM0760666.1 hypothetical protein [Sporomusa sphaeroides DSM 2875]